MTLEQALIILYIFAGLIVALLLQSYFKRSTTLKQTLVTVGRVTL